MTVDVGWRGCWIICAMGRTTLVVWRLDRLGRSLRDLIETIAELPEELRHLHALRHTCATELLRAGATIANVRVLGHASGKTTSIYLASGDERQAEIVRLRARQRPPTLDDDRDAASWRAGANALARA